MSRKHLFASFALAAVLAFGAVANANAVIITATETISDEPPFDLFSRDLTRTLTSDNGINIVETNDANIVASNSVDNDFGVWNADDVSFRHNLNWLNPTASNYLSATLTILAWGVDNGNDVVFADNINLGSLVNDGGGLLGEGFTTTIFSSFNPATLNVILADGFLNITVDKNANAGFPANIDFLSVYSSSLTVKYEAVPEPATMLLLGSGLIGAAVRRKRA
ncbi:MAG: PEP-CTERM sorting domain-containing protein [Bdellovibrionota bacterium]